MIKNQKNFKRQDKYLEMQHVRMNQKGRKEKRINRVKNLLARNSGINDPLFFLISVLQRHSLTLRAWNLLIIFEIRIRVVRSHSRSLEDAKVCQISDILALFNKIIFAFFVKSLAYSRKNFDFKKKIEIFFGEKSLIIIVKKDYIDKDLHFLHLFC